MSHQVDTLDAIMESLAREGERECVSVEHLVQTFGNRGSGALLIVPAMLELSPLGGIPGVPSLIALVIVILAMQIVVGRRHIWLPGFIGSRRIDGHRLREWVAKIRPLAQRLDQWFHGRLERFTNRHFVRPAAIACAVLMVSIPPLELIPFASSVPMMAVIAFGLALLVHDGLLMLFALALSTASVSLAIGILA